MGTNVKDSAKVFKKKANTSASSTKSDDRRFAEPLPAIRDELFLGYWVIGLLSYWVIKLMGYWVIGLLGYWVIGF